MNFDIKGFAPILLHSKALTDFGDKSHRIKWAEVQTKKHHAVDGYTNPAVDVEAEQVTGSEWTLTWNKKIKLSFSKDEPPSPNPGDPDLPMKSQLFGYRLTTDFSYELDVDKSDGYPVASEIGVPKLVRIDNTPSVGDGGPSLATYVTFRSQGNYVPLMAFIPLDGVNGVSNITYDLVPTNVNLDIMDILPVFYSTMFGGQQAGICIIMSFNVIDPVTSDLSLRKNTIRYPTDEVCQGYTFRTTNMWGVRFNGKTHTPDPTLGFYENTPPYNTVTTSFIGTIDFMGTHITGMDLQTISASHFVTEQDLEQIVERIDAVVENVEAQNEAFIEFVHIVANTLDAYGTAIDRLNDAYVNNNTLDDNIFSYMKYATKTILSLGGLESVYNMMEYIETAIDVAKSAFDYITNTGTEPETTVITNAIHTYAGIVSNIYNRSAHVDIVLFLAKLSRMSEIITEQEKNWVRVQTFFVDLEDLGAVVPILTKLVNIEPERLVKANLMPVHSMLHVYTRDGEHMFMSVGGGGKEFSILGRNLVWYITWTGEWNDRPESVDIAIDGRQMQIVTDAICVVEFSEIVNLAQVLSESDSPYNIIYNNCHDTTEVMTHFATSGLLPDLSEIEIEFIFKDTINALKRFYPKILMNRYRYYNKLLSSMNYSGDDMDKVTKQLVYYRYDDIQELKNHKFLSVLF